VLRWLEGAPADLVGATWGVAWPRGATQPADAFTLHADGVETPVQTWPLAKWPDGSIKWTAHAVGPAVSGKTALVLSRGQPLAPEKSLRTTTDADKISIDTGVVTIHFGAKGQSQLIDRIERDGKSVAGATTLVARAKDAPDGAAVNERSFTSRVDSVTLEQQGPVRAVVKLTGMHVSADGRAWLPFVVRAYAYAGSDAVRLVHSFVFDGDENKDFISGLGVRVDVPLRDQPHDRHVRFVGAEDGVFAEAVRGLTGLRRDPGAAVRKAQIDGKPTPAVDTWASSVSGRLNLIPSWSDYTLSQQSADGFNIRKRTKPGHGWIHCNAGTRAIGAGYLGGASGGIAFGLRDFWQRHPTQLDIRNATSEVGEVTLWMWSPEAPPMDIRFYHDGMGMEDHKAELEGLEITYEDYEKGFGTPYGAARTSELTIRALAATPSNAELASFARMNATPPVLASTPEHTLAAGVFGASMWSLPDKSDPLKAAIEREHEFFIDHYLHEIQQRRWYGFWDYGDVMHSYDGDRHVWRYDVGGFAWDNSELSPDLWLWYSYLRSGDAKIYRFAEAMTRHTSEVDVIHLGRFKGNGSRHNVQHWGCSCKQLRISTVVYRRMFYYLSGGDERIGDLMREQLDSINTFFNLDPYRKVRSDVYAPKAEALAVGIGTDWIGLASAWLTEWERTGNPDMLARIRNGMDSIAKLKYGFFTGDIRFNSLTWRYEQPNENPGAGASHLSAVFGKVEICAELIDLFGDADFEKAWLQYCRLYNGTNQEQDAELNTRIKAGPLTQAHSRLTAYAAKRLNDPKLASRAWREFWGGESLDRRAKRLATTRLQGPAVLNPIDELPYVGTNGSAQWGLAAMQCLALVGARIEPPVAR
jgi:hypothetical protein